MDINFIGLILASIMASAVPLILASCGELITERSGVLNLGVDGMMIIGAISGFALMTVTGNLFVGDLNGDVSSLGTSTFTNIIISNGAIDGTTIGGTSAAAGSFTTITASTSIDVTGTAGIILQNDETITNATDGTVVINGIVAAGTGSGTGIFQSNGDYDLKLQTGNSTTGNITITDGGSGDITLNPHGSGEVVVNSKLDVTGTSTLASAKVSDLTSGEVVYGGTDGLLKTDGNFTYDGTTVTLPSLTATSISFGSLSGGTSGTSQSIEIFLKL